VICHQRAQSNDFGFRAATRTIFLTIRDFVEDLRTVHFALIGSAALLILLSFGTHNEETAKALTDATEIEQMRSDWKSLDDRHKFATALHDDRHQTYWDHWSIQPEGLLWA
jgi:hypothetical protein